MVIWEIKSAQIRFKSGWTESSDTDILTPEHFNSQDLLEYLEYSPRALVQTGTARKSPKFGELISAWWHRLHLSTAGLGFWVFFKFSYNKIEARNDLDSQPKEQDFCPKTKPAMETT